MRIVKGAILGALAVLAIASSASAQSPTMVVAAEKVQKGPFATTNRTALTQSIRLLELKDEEMRISLSAQNTTACQMQMPNGAWVGIPSNYASFPIGPSGVNVNGRTVPDQNGFYPKLGEVKVIRFMCMSGSGATIRDSVRISR